MAERKNNAYIVDGNKLFGYIRIQALASWMKIQEYRKEVIWMSYNTVFYIKRKGGMYKKTKDKLDAVFGNDPTYLKLYSWVVTPPQKETTKKVQKRLVIDKKKSINKALKARKKKDEPSSVLS